MFWLFLLYSALCFPRVYTIFSGTPLSSVLIKTVLCAVCLHKVLGKERDNMMARLDGKLYCRVSEAIELIRDSTIYLPIEPTTLCSIFNVPMHATLNMENEPGML